MPYQWHKDEEAETLTLWPHRSLSREGFVTFIGATVAMFYVPLLAAMGTPVLFGLLPFFGIAIAAIWYALKRSYADGQIFEKLQIQDQEVCVEHHGRGCEVKFWRAHQAWVQVRVHASGGPVEHYITLRGGQREIELGRFLSAEERKRLAGELRRALARGGEWNA